MTTTLALSPNERLERDLQLGEQMEVDVAFAGAARRELPTAAWMATAGPAVPVGAAGACEMPWAEERNAERVRNAALVASGSERDAALVTASDRREAALVRSAVGAVSSDLDKRLGELKERQAAREAARAAAEAQVRERLAKQAAAQEEARREAARAAAEEQARKAVEEAEKARVAQAAAAQKAEAEKAAAEKSAAEKAAAAHQAAAASGAVVPTVPAASTAPISTAAAGPSSRGGGGRPSEEHAQAIQRIEQATNDAKAFRQLPGMRDISAILIQIARVHNVVCEKAGLCADTLAGVRNQGGGPAVTATCFTLAKRLISQGETLVDKNPGMAYAFAAFALQVGEREPEIWEWLDCQLKASCCYCVPHYATLRVNKAKTMIERPNGEMEKRLDYYTRMAGLVSFYAALLQHDTVLTFQPGSNVPTPRKITSPLGVPAAWRWLARLLNRKPETITATILLAFLKPSAHALLRTYPRQFPKLLRLIRHAYLPRMEAEVNEKDEAEGKAALSNLTTWLDSTLQTIERQGPSASLPDPPEMEMPLEKPPDNTNDGGGDGDNW
jgi:nucleoporin GLE1